MTVALRDKRKRDWFWGEKSAIERLENDAQVAVYVALLILSGEGSIIWASQDTISRVAHVSSRTVARTLPDLERLGVLRRADDKTLERLAERLAEVPGTVVYELQSVDRLAPDAPVIERDERDIEERLMDLDPNLHAGQRKKGYVAILRKWLSEQTGREVEFPWLIRLYDQARDETELLLAARATVRAKPQGSVLGYMTRVIRKTAEAQSAPVVDLSTETAQQFGGF